MRFLNINGFVLETCAYKMSVLCVNVCIGVRVFVCKYRISKGYIKTMITKTNKVKAVGPYDVIVVVWRCLGNSDVYFLAGLYSTDVWKG